MGLVTLPVRNLFIGVVVKLLLNIVLIPMFGINGAALATVGSYIIATGLNLYAVAHYTGARFGLSTFFLKPFLAVSLMGFAAFAARQAAERGLASLIASPRLYFTAVSMAAVGAGVIMYAVALFLSGTVRRADLESTRAGRKLIPWLTRFRLLHE
jgi:O-antigen/teichoic acid export membrane protein